MVYVIGKQVIPHADFPFYLFTFAESIPQVALHSKHIAVALHCLIWGAVLLLPYFFIGPESHYAQIGFVRCNFFTATNIIHIGLFYFNAYFLYSRLLNRRMWWIYLLSAAAMVLILYQVKWVILRAWFPVLASEPAAAAFTFFPIVFFLALSTGFRLVSDKINQEREHMAMELKFLRSQVNPHFLFNVLNNLVSMARHRSEQLEPSLIKLSGLMRYMLFESDERKIPLSTEVEYLENYIDLQKLRFGEGDPIEALLEIGDNEHLIEPMLLIPFVENAFKHGVMPDARPIRISLRVENDWLRFVVSNRFEKGSQGKDRTPGIGLGNVKARLKLLYPRRHRLTIAKKNDIFEVDLAIKLS